MTLAERFGTDVFISGWGHTKFGSLPDETLESLVVRVAGEAITSAGIEPGQVDEIWFGQFNSGLWPLGFASSLALQVSDELFGVPATRVENACASGPAAIHSGLRSLLAGTARTVLVIGAEKMTHAPAEQVGAALLGADYELAGSESRTGFAGLFARVAEAYRQRYGEINDALGAIAAKNHANGMANPLAHLRKQFTPEFCSTTSEKNPMVAEPLRRTDCSPISDGAAALVLTTQPSTSAAQSPVRLLGFGQANDFMPANKRDPVEFAGSVAAWERARKMAGVGLDDLDLIELHDCFTIAELVMYEVLGLAERGKGRQVLEDGTVFRDGKLPVNLSGGLKSKGHPVGATGVSQHVMAAMQLSGTAGELQLPGARRAAVHNMGGLAVANYVSVLEAV
ncbi:acetyl-CoA acetyltransferase [Saccharomonospora viridis]|uniref:Acetyl-CoA acetyltransferase n=1 Tax=Saccharomonospora viridis TaxID=1852 RepID=A0A837D6A2_9PSEU|nr:acetyl-CoA acetyltransferase [Saccharomonospora viridis]KHF43130.1 acetyl-CoA acetyltransferase [Saccharomonospora viridis]SFO84171.1 acetyl-CoA C-acetyltransferase [Saccharomonospora viridis]